MWASQLLGFFGKARRLCTPGGFSLRDDAPLWFYIWGGHGLLDLLPSLLGGMDDATPNAQASLGSRLRDLRQSVDGLEALAGEINDGTEDDILEELSQQYDRVIKQHVDFLRGVRETGGMEMSRAVSVLIKADDFLAQEDIGADGLDDQLFVQAGLDRKLVLLRGISARQEVVTGLIVRLGRLLTLMEKGVVHNVEALTQILKSSTEINIGACSVCGEWRALMFKAPASGRYTICSGCASIRPDCIKK